MPQVFPRQGENECGAYVLAYGLRASPREMAARVTHQVPGTGDMSGNFPWAILDVLKRHGRGGKGFSAR